MEEEKILNPISGIISLLIYLFIGFVIAQFVSVILVLPFIIDYDNPMQIVQKLESMFDYPELRYPILWIQAISSLIAFIIVPILYMRSYKISFDELTGRFTKIQPALLLTVVGLVLLIFPFLTFIYEWNMSWVFPTQFHEWATAQEESMKLMTEYLLEMNGPVDLIFVLIVVAIIPGIGEELLFRGLLQTQLSFAIKNIHVTIWLTAFIFAAIHMQFFGLVPRMLLGAIFGYIFYWSGSLKYSMIAHAANNGFNILAAYFLSGADSEFNLDEETSFPLYIVAISIVLTVGLLLFFKRSFENEDTVQVEN